MVLGGGVAADLIAREQTFGGTLSYRAYLSTKLQWDAFARDLTYAFAAAGALALVYLAFTRRLRTRLVLPLICLLGVTLALTFAWIVHIPLSYLRMAYYAPRPPGRRRRDRAGRPAQALAPARGRDGGRARGRGRRAGLGPGHGGAPVLRLHRPGGAARP